MYVFSEALGQFFRLSVSVNAIRSVDKNGGIDGFLAKAKDAQLSETAKKLRKTILNAQQEQAAA